MAEEYYLEHGLQYSATIISYYHSLYNNIVHEIIHLTINNTYSVLTAFLNLLQACEHKLSTHTLVLQKQHSGSIHNTYFRTLMRCFLPLLENVIYPIIT